MSDAEELDGIVKLHLVEDDYAVLRAFEGRCKFSSYISVVVQRLTLDFRNHTWGKWRPSAEARRLGDLAVALEQLILRDGRTLDDAVTLLAGKHDGVSPASLAALAAKLPKRSPRPRNISLDDAHGEMAAQASNADDAVLTEERRRAAENLSRVLTPILDRLPQEDRLIFQLHFENEMTVAEIARALGLDQKQTYRRVERIEREIKREIERAGFTPHEIRDLIGRDEVFLRFDIGNPASRPSMPNDERTGPHTEES